MAHLLAERAAEAGIKTLGSKYERSLEFTTKTKPGTTSMSNPHSFKNGRAVTEEERKRLSHYDKRISHDQEVLREQRERERQNQEQEARDRERRAQQAQHIPTGPSRGYSSGYHQQSRPSFHARDSSTTVAPSPRDRGVFDRDGPLVVTVPERDLSRRNSEQFSPLRHRLAPKPVVGEKNEIETVARDLQEEEKVARMLKNIDRYKAVATEHLQAEKEYKAANGALSTVTSFGKKYEGVQKVASAELTKLHQRRLSAKAKAEEIGHEFREVLIDMVRHEMSLYNIQKQEDAAPSASNEEVIALKKQVSDLLAKVELLGKAVEKPRHPDPETISLQRRCDDLSQRIDSRKDYSDRINKAEMDISQLNVFRKSQEKTNEENLGKFKKINESMTNNRDEIDKTKREIKESQKKTGTTLEEHANSIKDSEQKISSLLQEYKSLQDKLNTTVTEAEELKRQLEGRHAELKTAVDGMKQALNEKSQEHESSKKEMAEKDQKLTAHLMRMDQHVKQQGTCLLELQKSRDDQHVKYLGMLKAIDGQQNQIKKTSADVIAHVDKSVSILKKELDIIVNAPTMTAPRHMIEAVESSHGQPNGVVRVKQEGMDDMAIAEDVDDDWQSDPKIAKFAEEMLVKLRNEVNPDIFNPERIQILRTQVGNLGEKYARLEDICRNIKQAVSEFATKEQLAALEMKIQKQLNICEALVEETTERLVNAGLPATPAQSIAATNGHGGIDLLKDITSRLSHSTMPSPSFIAKTPPLVRPNTPSKSVSIPPETAAERISRRNSVVSNPGTPSGVASPVNRSTPVVTSYTGTTLQADSRWRAVPSLAGHKRPRAAEDADSEDRAAKKDSN
ncbi:hypothetical protein BJ508DRAFT_305171 [Ascobolus immersus RN42]|uniref:Uncharacterized protein n=1 Tax=Ascobolus immersus RN42 TaxID=1160509 RepID=A0A3N4IBP5_ASCIM|nr:hypothetical protein BJ508DRAFT_305171 [Ascobolus immersus RN42]